ncbi:MAG TPA: hypothetical protein VEA92_03605 [Candidatus Paceibacterota bacterium]|nr:hypothetical protein [Candidatus Paceibacterota bacterium]
MTYIRTFAIALLLATALSLPSSASAASVSDLIAQLEAIQAQLSQMKGQVLGVSASADEPLVLPGMETTSPTTGQTTPTTTPAPTTTKNTEVTPEVLPGVSTTDAGVIYMEVVEVEANTEQDNTLGDYTITVEVTADDNDVYVPLSGGTNARSGFAFDILSSPRWKGTVSSAVSAYRAVEVGSYARIEEGETEVLELNVWLDPNEDGEYRVRLSSIQYTDTPGGALSVYLLNSRERKQTTTETLRLLGEAGSERSTIIEPVSTDADVTYTDIPQHGTFEIDFDVTALGGDAYISATEGVIWGVFGPGMHIPKNVAHTLTSTASKSGGFFIVDEEETERFTVTASAVAEKTGPHKLELKGLIHKGSADGKIDVYSLGGRDFTTKPLTLIAGTTTVKGAFNIKTLSAKKENPTIKGTASGTKTVGFSIGNGDKVYGSGDIRVKKNGKWSHKVQEDLRAGTYTITLYANNVELAKETLTVRLKEEDVASKMAIVAGIYEGYYPNGRGFQQHTEGTVTLNIKADSSYPAQPLVLSSYESTNWIINNPNRAKISKIIAIGHYKQRVTGVPSGTPIEYYTVREGDSVPVVTKKDGELVKLEQWLLDRGLYYSGVYFGGTNASSIDIEYGYKG